MFKLAALEQAHQAAVRLPVDRCEPRRSLRRRRRRPGRPPRPAYDVVKKALGRSDGRRSRTPQRQDRRRTSAAAGRPTGRAARAARRARPTSRCAAASCAPPTGCATRRAARRGRVAPPPPSATGSSPALVEERGTVLSLDKVRGLLAGRVAPRRRGARRRAAGRGRAQAPGGRRERRARRRGVSAEERERYVRIAAGFRRPRHAILLETASDQVADEDRAALNELRRALDSGETGAEGFQTALRLGGGSAADSSGSSSAPRRRTTRAAVNRPARRSWPCRPRGARAPCGGTRPGRPGSSPADRQAGRAPASTRRTSRSGRGARRPCRRGSGSSRGCR